MFEKTRKNKELGTINEGYRLYREDKETSEDDKVRKLILENNFFAKLA